MALGLLRGLLAYGAQDGSSPRRGLLDFINDPTGEQGIRKRLLEEQLSERRGRQMTAQQNFGGFDPSSGITWDTGRPGSAGEAMLAGMPQQQQAAARGLLQMDPDKGMGLLAERAFPKPADLTTDQREYHLAKSQGFKGSFIEYQGAKAAATRAPPDPYARFRSVGNTLVDLGSMNTPDASGAAPSGQISGGPRPVYTSPRDEGESRAFSESAKLRGEYTTQAKPFIEARQSLGRMEASAKDDSAAGDIAMVYSFMKMLDPTSVVREGEFATAQNAGGVPDRIVAQYNRILNGERLTPNIRGQFMSQARNQFRQVESQHKPVRETYTRLARQSNLDPSMVVVDLTSPENPAEASPPAPPPAPAPAALPPKETRVVGQVYDTPKGKAKWMGQGWELVR